MQYFMALKVGQKRVGEAREYLNKFANGKAMPALALKDNKTNVWEPGGEENLYAVVNGASGFVDTFLYCAIKMVLQKRLPKDYLMKKNLT